MMKKGQMSPAPDAAGDVPGMPEGLSKMEQMKWKRENKAAVAATATVPPPDTIPKRNAMLLPHRATDTKQEETIADQISQVSDIVSEMLGNMNDQDDKIEEIEKTLKKLVTVEGKANKIEEIEKTVEELVTVEGKANEDIEGMKQQISLLEWRVSAFIPGAGEDGLGPLGPLNFGGGAIKNHNGLIKRKENQKRDLRKENQKRDLRKKELLKENLKNGDEFIGYYWSRRIY